MLQSQCLSQKTWLTSDCSACLRKQGELLHVSPQAARCPQTLLQVQHKWQPICACQFPFVSGQCPSVVLMTTASLRLAFPLQVAQPTLLQNRWLGLDRHHRRTNMTMRTYDSTGEEGSNKVPQSMQA